MTKAPKLDPAGCREVLVNPGARVIIDMDDTTGKKGRGITKGENAAEFKTEASAILKQHAPMQYARWKKIPTDRKKMLWLAMKQKFNLQENVEIKKVVFEQLNRQYRSLRHKLHDHYAKNKDDEKIFEQPPDGITVENWQVLIDYFESDEFKILSILTCSYKLRWLSGRLSEILVTINGLNGHRKDCYGQFINVTIKSYVEVSDRNKRNRDKLKMAHTCGTRSITQYCYEERDLETGQEPTPTSTWMKNRFSNKKKDWIDDASREAYEDIMKLQNEGGVDTEGPVSEDEAFIKVLGPEKPSRLRGCGDGLKPPSKRGESINQELAKENEELRKQADADRECTQSLMRENKELASRLDSLESQFSQIPTILQNLTQMTQFVQTPPNNMKILGVGGKVYG
ncbi:hypothetical protein PHJA_000356000 [Phtheirospermum japonicum]|uniref:Uncharacterized protein n=1 Tax=Phtheirospermum japonicum TaxID=374723 RepID=A0A830B4W9_9LAMI|nr:hypothetical protein PHJA_000356000 [Phtheirospermum japonicum]